MNLAIVPRDPLLARDGKPFSSAIPGSRARSLPFATPQMVAGTVRTVYGFTRGLSFRQNELQEVLQVAIKGPLPLIRNGDEWEFLFPAPSDGLPVRGSKGGSIRMVPLVPRKPSQTERVNRGEDWQPLFPMEDDLTPEKPPAAPSWWPSHMFRSWLLGEKVQWEEASAQFPAPAEDTRVHVMIDPETRTAKEGMLFSTQSLEFVWKGKGASLSQARELALWVGVVTPHAVSLEGVHPIGGERRLALWQKGPEPWDMSDELLQMIRKSRGARVILLTPSYFQGGFAPKDQKLYGASIRAAAIGRPLVVSGWDMAKGQPKPSRRLVPAGSVYFVEFPEDWGFDRKERWAKDIWWQCIADGDEHRRNGEGLAVVGVWEP